MNITTEMIKELRDATGVSVMQCKKALEESGGDMEKAKMVLRKNSADQAAKKADRTLGAGIVTSYIHSTKRMGVLLELSCETDFVSQNEEFIGLANNLALHIAAMGPEYINESQIDEVAKEKAKAFFAEEIAGLQKPEEMKAKILEAKLNDYFSEKVLTKQAFMLNPEITIQQLIDGVVQKTGERIEVGRFIKYQI